MGDPAARRARRSSGRTRDIRDGHGQPPMGLVEVAPELVCGELLIYVENL